MPFNVDAVQKYDANGNQVWARDPNNVGLDATYDERNRRLTQADTQEQAEGKNHATAYDANSNLKSTIDAKGNTTTLVYDARGRKVSQTDRIAGVTTWGYDQNGNLLTLCDPDNQAAEKATHWTYDVRNLKLTESYPDHDPMATPPVNDQKTFTYDLAGRPMVFTDQQGDTVTHAFDAANRLLSRAYHSLSGAQPDDTDTLTYDDAGRLLVAQSGRYNNSVTMTYGDGAGRLTSESLAVNFENTPRNYTVQSLYDEAGHRTQITYPDGTVVTRSYNERDQLAQIGYNNDMVASFDYDNGGRRRTRTLGDTRGTVTTWFYDRQDNLITGVDTPNVTSFGYTFDANKNKLTETLGTPMADYGFGTTTPTAYDNEDRLTAWSRSDGKKRQSWDLTGAGDWRTFTENSVAQNRDHSPVHAFTKIDGVSSLAYDTKGNLITNSNAQTYIWDFDNRMYSAAVSGNTHNYTYDALGRRVSKTVADGTNSAITVFVCVTQPIEHSPYAGQEVVEYVGGALSTSPSKKYVFGEYIDELLVMGVPASGSETKYFYHHNNIYSVTALTNQAGAVVERYAYTAYGKKLFCDASGTLLSQQQSIVGNPYLFTGRRFDAETSLDYFRARCFDADQGRFSGRDPIENQVNVYAYTENRPLDAIDPSGLATTIVCHCALSYLVPNVPPVSYDVEVPITYLGGATGDQKCKEACEIKKPCAVSLCTGWEIKGKPNPRPCLDEEICRAYTDCSQTDCESACWRVAVYSSGLCVAIGKKNPAAGLVCEEGVVAYTVSCYARFALCKQK